MTTHTPDTDPLDDDEQALARIVCALPAGEPPTALDARILKTASAALATPTRRRAAWLGSAGSLWGIGSAAAAVLAIGIAWQRMNPALPSLPATSPAPVPEEARDDGRSPVAFKPEAPRPFDNSPPLEPPRLAPRRADEPRSALAAAPAAKAFPHDGLDEHVPEQSRQMQAPMPAPAMAEAQAGAVADALAPRNEQAATATGTVAATGRVAADAKLYPESWLLKIRSRLKDGDGDGARASLRLFVARYPTQTVPDDLKILLEE